MAEPELTECTDPELGLLVWDGDDGVWVGGAHVGGRAVCVEIDPDRERPSREERLASIESFGVDDNGAAFVLRLQSQGA